MSSVPLPKPLQVVAMMKQLGICKELQFAAYMAMEPYEVLTWEQFRDTLRTAGLNTAQRMEVRDAHRLTYLRDRGVYSNTY